MASQAAGRLARADVVDPREHGVGGRVLAGGRHRGGDVVLGLRVVDEGADRRPRQLVGRRRLGTIPVIHEGDPGQEHDRRRGGGDGEQDAVRRASQAPGARARARGQALRGRGPGLLWRRGAGRDLGYDDEPCDRRTGRGRATPPRRPGPRRGASRTRPRAAGSGSRWSAVRTTGSGVTSSSLIAPPRRAPGAAPARARWRREATVPGATPRMSAASRWSKPSPSTSTTVTRWSIGQRGQGVTDGLRGTDDPLRPRAAGFGVDRVLRGEGGALALAELVDARVVGDAVEPRPEVAAGPEPREGLEGLEVGLLERIVHAMAIGHQAVGQPPHAHVVPAQQLVEGRPVARAGQLDQLDIGERGGRRSHREGGAARPRGAGGGATERPERTRC